MQVDWGVELGADDEVLEIPWAISDAGPRYWDLKRHPDHLPNVEEANRFPELAEFLRAVNSSGGMLETAKCDVWSSTDMNPEEEIFGALHKFGSYVDLVFADEGSRFSFPEHEQFVKRIVELLRRVPEIPASSEFLVRRCYYHVADPNGPRQGFYVTNYLFGYGTDERQARQRWLIGMKLVENLIRQISAKRAAKG
jgi:hypothetical protein